MFAATEWLQSEKKKREVLLSIDFFAGVNPPRLLNALRERMSWQEEPLKWGSSYISQYGKKSAYVRTRSTGLPIFLLRKKNLETVFLLSKQKCWLKRHYHTRVSFENMKVSLSKNSSESKILFYKSSLHLQNFTAGLKENVVKIKMPFLPLFWKYEEEKLCPS